MGVAEANCTWDDLAATLPENRNQRAQYVAVFSLRISVTHSFIYAREILKIYPLSPIAYIEAVFL